MNVVLLVILAALTPISPPSHVALPQRTQVALRNLNGLPAVDVSLEGSHPRPFVIDFAANLFAMSPATAHDLQLKVIGKDEMGNDNVALKTLKIGDASFEGLVAAVDPFLAGRAESGVLGVNVFSEALVTIDFPRNIFVVESGRLPAANGADILAVAEAEGEAPKVDITICGTKVRAGIDTAAPAVLRLPAGIVQSLKCATKTVGGANVVGAQSGEEAVEKVELQGDLRLGRITVVHPVCVVGRGPDALIGAGLLRHYAVTLDQRSKTVRFSGPKSI